MLTYFRYNFLTGLLYLEENIGVILPQDMEKDQMAKFESLLKQFTLLHEEALPLDLTQEENVRLSSKIAKFLLSGQFVEY